MVSVQDLESRTFRLIFLHRLDCRAPRSPTVGNVVAFSKPCHAAVRAEKLQLGTPAHYRRASLKPGIDDRHDGTLTRGGTRWANSAVRAGGVTHADLTLVSPHEPWVYCAAHYRDSSEVHALKLPCLSALRIHPLGVDCVPKMASGSILHVVCVCINRIGTEASFRRGIPLYGRDRHRRSRGLRSLARHRLRSGPRQDGGC